MRRCLPFAIAAALLLPGAAARAQGTFDGTYRGEVGPVAGSHPNCFGVRHTVRVVGGHIRHIFYYAEFSLGVAPDGSIQGSAMQTHTPRGAGRVVELHGRIVGNTLTVDYGNSICTMHGVLKKR